MKTLKVVLQEVISGVKAWANDNFSLGTHVHGNITNDGKVGTTANLPLITGTGGAVQAGSFGNQANTFCEGNDSRLSDARTPVAHTHGKADITDLFNSANTWSADQTLTSQAYIKSPTWEKGVEPSSATHKNIYFVDKNNAVVGTIRRRISNGSQSFQLFGSALVKNGQLDPTGDNVTWGFSQIFNSDGSTYFQFDGNIGNSIVPRLNNTYGLGSSTLKWKTLNGINPGALSLPNLDSDGYVDLSDNLTENVQYSYTPVADGWLALYAQINGFHAENAVGIFNADLTLGNDSFRWANTAIAAINLQRQTGKYFGSIFLPVRAGYPYYCWLRVDQSTILGQKKLIFYKAKGNV